MLAMSKLLSLKGHNGYSPCRFCLIRGERNLSTGRGPYYVPLRGPIRPGQPHNDGWDPPNLPEQTFDNLCEQLNEIENSSTLTARKELAKFYGVNEKSRLLCLPSLSFPNAFPPDIMHLFFENIFPMLHDHWTCSGRYKDKPPADPGYVLAPHIWEEIGKETARAYQTIPSEFVGAMPDISKSKYKAKYSSFWTIYFGPILLHNRFPNNKYYNHFCLLVRIIKACLQFTITDEQLEELQENIISWVEKYER